MLAALTPYSRETVRHAVTIAKAYVPYSLTSQLNSCEIQCFSNKLEIFEENSDKYINIINECKDMQEEENEGEYLNVKKWKLIELCKKTDSRGRVHLGETYYNKDIRVFVSDLDKDPETCKHYILLPYNTFTEVTKSRRKGEIGDPLKVQLNGDVWTTIKNKDKFVKIFVRK